MAGDWIPYSKGLARRSEVLTISSVALLSRFEVTGALLEFWSWADEETTDGMLKGVKLEHLPSIIGLSINFWHAVVSVGWLSETVDGIIVTNFKKWMSNPAKSRLKNTKRALLSRSKRDKSATKALPQNRTEQNSINTPLRPPPQNAKAKLAETAERIVAHYQEVVAPAHNKSRGVANVSKVLKEGMTEEQLKHAATGYARAVAESEPQFRKSVGNFFGRDATYREFLEWKEGEHGGNPPRQPLGRVAMPAGKYDGIPVIDIDTARAHEPAATSLDGRETARNSGDRPGTAAGNSGVH